MKVASLMSVVLLVVCASSCLADDTAPVITSFQAIEGPNNLWTFSGTMTDPDPTTGLTMVFGGAYHGTTLVREDGTFSKTVMLPPGIRGTVTAQVTDRDGEQSNIALALLN